ncbi:hypothetical protein PROFUN_02027 [Planoprotostelium fungivorum]|uniref:Uncharacterized protein n=1 Tax=Planoprotostelium fungivorum TaxID=1890364 RepID=A0A2P6NB78_9EUKA|nr:hypothetical protein PROFUN_02027 [Planoprotostelium fungivorum]
MEPLSIIALIVAASIFVLYHVYYILLFIFKPFRTNLGSNLSMRHKWAHWIICSTGQEVFAVQTIRNTSMSANMLGAGSVAAAYFLLTQSVARDDTIGIVYRIITGFLLAAFLCFGLVTRDLGHASFLCGIRETPQKSYHLFEHKTFPYEAVATPADADLESAGLDKVRFASGEQLYRYLRRASILNTVGFRLLYASILFATWVVGPIPTLVVSCLLTAAIFALDQP